MFSDYHLFDIVDDGTGRIIPIHYRPLGEKEGRLYKNVRWSDVVINGALLDKKFEFEDKVEYLSSKINENYEKSVTIVNSREHLTRKVYGEDNDEENKIQDKIEMRLQNMKLSPMTFKQAKNKKTSSRAEAKVKVKVKVKERFANAQEMRNEIMNGEMLTLQGIAGMYPEEINTYIYKTH